MMHVKPAREGLIVMDPASYRPLPAEGAEVPRTSYWLRRLNDGDVVLVAPAASPTARRAPSSKE